MFTDQKRHLLSQNFLYNPYLVKKILRESSICQNDTVIEIGPGEGIITEQLIAVSRFVLAIETDPSLANHLSRRFFNSTSLTVFNMDFLKFHLPYTPYKIFSNLPFAIEGEIIRKLLDAQNPPEESCLIAIKDVARRWAGIPREGEFSLIHKPWFEMEITHQFRRTDFEPVPKIDSVLLRITKRKAPLITKSREKIYKQFIHEAFGGGGRLGQNLVRLFVKQELQNIAQKQCISLSSKPSDLTLNQWINLFDEWPKMKK